MQDSKWEEHAPPEFQNLVRSDTGECESSPNEHDEEHEPRLHQRHHGAGDEQVEATDSEEFDGADGALEGQVPATKEEVSEQETSGVGTNVFGHKEHTESHTAVLRPPTFNQFGLSLRHVERDTLYFSDHRDEEESSAEWHQEDVPCTSGVLEVNAVHDVECA